MQLLVEDFKVIDDITIYLKLFKLHQSFLLLISDQLNMGIVIYLRSPMPVLVQFHAALGRLILAIDLGNWL